MNNKLVACSVLMILACAPGFAFNSGLLGVEGETVFDKAFIEDYELARVQLVENGTLTPMLDLLQKYERPIERAELELTIGLAYNQRTGLVNPAKAVQHLSNALRFRLPEKTSIDILLWRGSSYEQLKQPKKALEDYLRGLVACSYYDLSREWPDIKEPPRPIYMNSSDPENEVRARDYKAYRDRTGFISHILMQKYYFVDSVRRVQKESGIDDLTVLEFLGKLTPDTHVVAKIRQVLSEENKRPWP